MSSDDEMPPLDKGTNNDMRQGNKEKLEEIGAGMPPIFPIPGTEGGSGIEKARQKRNPKRHQRRKRREKRKKKGVDHREEKGKEDVYARSKGADSELRRLSFGLIAALRKGPWRNGDGHKSDPTNPGFLKA